MGCHLKPRHGHAQLFIELKHGRERTGINSPHRTTTYIFPSFSRLETHKAENNNVLLFCLFLVAVRFFSVKLPTQRNKVSHTGLYRLTCCTSWESNQADRVAGKRTTVANCIYILIANHLHISPIKLLINSISS